MIIFRLLASVIQMWSWIGMGYFWHANNMWAMAAFCIAAIAISLIVAFVEVLSEDSR